MSSEQEREPDPHRDADGRGAVHFHALPGLEHDRSLEAGLKALWPSADERVEFLGLGEEPSLGHGDLENAGFSRGEPAPAPSLLVVVLLTDEDDCSTPDTALFTPNSYLMPDDPLLSQGLNMRCALNQDRLYPIERYARGLQLLREGAEQLVLFAAITGVPTARVNREAMSAFDYADDDARDAFYQALLDDPEMELRAADNGTPDPADDTLQPACQAESGLAYPARRITEVARSFGPDGMVQSICEQNFDQAVGFVLQRVAARMRDPMGEAR